uniref:EF-P 5-aminopentanol modification-associated protein YfmF n=1 Tax=Lacticaseibacillus jixiensis TaxID=3231926 RepID=UPI0036F30EB3
MVKIQPGVQLSVVHTTQFKTTRIAVHFLAPLNGANVAARTLLTSVLETASQKYPTQAQLSAHLEAMFGASFGIGVGKEGTLHRVSASLNLLNDRFAQEDLLAQGFALLKEVLLQPLFGKSGFDTDLFDREKHNLMLYLQSLQEDRQTQASLALQRVYFQGDPAQATPSFGTAELLDTVTNADLLATYQAMLAQDRIEIVVLGDVDEAQVVQLAKALDFAPRTVAAQDLTVTTPAAALRQQVETAPVLQAKLNLAYRVPVSFYGPDHYAAVVANDLFGGSPLSKLFTNVREKASLAYYASSSLDGLRQLMTVQTGIDGENAPRVQELIQAQLKQVQQGDFTDARLAEIKAGLVSNRETAYDSPRFLARQALLRALLPSQPQSLAEYVAGINAVDRHQVMQAAMQMQLAAVYCLKGGQDRAD